jgi:ubiquinone/menaquinone biosynthesis C-methylase UbiE
MNAVDKFCFEPMTAAVDSKPRLASRLVNGVLSIKPLFNLAKSRARTMMIKRAESIGVPWTEIAAELRSRDWTTEFNQVNNPNLQYPDYYLRPFHAYDEGNLGWEPATEVEVAAYAVHTRIWQDAGKDGDSMLRRSYHEVLKNQISTAPKDIVDLGCSVGMSTFTLQETFPGSTITGVDLSPYFLAVAQYRSDRRNAPEFSNPSWVHAAAESTGLPSASYDLVSACLLFHELPQSAARAIFQEARRLLRPGGHLAIMDMNPKSEIYAKMPPYILTLLKSTEPYMDEYFTLDIEQAIVDAGFSQPMLTRNSPRHRTLIAQVK